MSKSKHKQGVEGRRSRWSSSRQALNKLPLLLGIALLPIAIRSLSANMAGWQHVLWILPPVLLIALSAYLISKAD